MPRASSFFSRLCSRLLSRPLSCALVCIAVFTANAAHAGPGADAMGKCLMDHASQADRSDLMRWMFINASLHPDVASLVAIAPQTREAVERKAAQLLQRLVFDNCRNESVAAMRSEGPAAMQRAFQMLGQLAGDSLTADPAVNQGFANALRYIDASRLLGLLMP